MTRVIDPTPESFRSLSRDVPADVPIVMLNLLRCRDEAAYPSGSEHSACSGREADARYGAHAFSAVKAAGGEVVFAGTPGDLVSEAATLTGKHLKAYLS